MPQITKSGCIIRDNEEIALPRNQLDKVKQLIKLGNEGKIMGINARPKEDPNVIYTVTTFEHPTRRLGRNDHTYDWRESRTVGWFSTLAEAEHIVTHNACDINEDGYYPYAVIQPTEEGPYSLNWDSYWYEWNGEQYVPCEKPEEFKQTINFGMG